MITDGSNTATITAITEDTNVIRNAATSTGLISSINNLITKNEDDFQEKDAAGDYFSADADTLYVGKYPGSMGNSLKVSVCDSANAYQSTINVGTSAAQVNLSISDISITLGSNAAVVRIAANTTANAEHFEQTNTQISAIRTALTVGDYITFGNNTIGKFLSKVSSIGALTKNSTHSYASIGIEDSYTLATDFTATSFVRNWEYFNTVDKTIGTSEFVTASGNSAALDEVHVIVVDDDGLFSGVPGTIIETFEGLSRATNAKSPDGATLYYKDVINQNSQYVWLVNHRSNADANTALNITTSTNTKPFTGAFVGGTDGKDETSCAISMLTNAYDLFASAEEVDVSLILQGKARGGTNGEQLGNYIIDNICESRKDCVAFISPDRADVVSNIGQESDDLVTFRNSTRSTSYGVLDSGYKYQYDKYNDVYRYIPLNGDMAGLTVRTDETRDPWWSPAGFNRGQIKNIIKLAYNPNKANRDVLYKANINPVVTFPGQGTVLFGDKTMLSKPSAFDRINVRRLFIVLEKAIATAAKFTLFEFNDDFTRAQFRNLVEPFLRDVQGRRGIYDFKVVCDETNNTGEVIDRNEFVGDIYIKPARSINFIQLNFVAVRTGVEFSEVVGQF